MHKIGPHSLFERLVDISGLGTEFCERSGLHCPLRRFVTVNIAPINILTTIVLPNCPQLRRLNLVWNEIEDEGFSRLAQVVAALNLNYLDVRWNSTTMEGREALRKACQRKKVAKVHI